MEAVFTYPMISKSLNCEKKGDGRFILEETVIQEILPVARE